MSTLLVLLGGSTGGPAAVKEFIDALPERPLPVCFVLANHISHEFLPNLQNMLDDHPHVSAEIIDGNKTIMPGKLYIAPIEHRICFNPEGRIYVVDEPWRAPYAPNINQMFESALDMEKFEKLAIIFSGMDDDGSASAELLDSKEVEIWCQTLESCVQASMPLSMMRTGKVIYKDNPKGLATQLADYLDSRNSVDQYA
ncbi:chemotaxis protein CheB [Kangiella sediminilitoris]|uniref:protein-glutamate methylesterase n=1 Tax=Kangiella sediminilitoris TaxID=1144748 RepID=A0A1B3BDU4_9GAMM|nr:chemotaxis protein CheB [Kangiella sediminilitoris]AOE50867.1 CheB methylesterase [Kangiella sediminilitoris]